MTVASFSQDLFSIVAIILTIKFVDCSPVCRILLINVKVHMNSTNQIYNMFRSKIMGSLEDQYQKQF